MKLFDDRDSIKKMDEAGRKLVEEKFTDKIMINKNEGVYINYNVYSVGKKKYELNKE